VTCPYREWDVAYVLGSLSPADRQVYERHLALCPPCEHEVCRLAGTAGLLSRVPAKWAVESLGPSAGVPATVLPRLARAVRRRRLLVTVTTILVAAVLGAVLTFYLCP
jgi:anti-sigma factor RsiW